jgi:hypothetical protein
MVVQNEPSKGNYNVEYYRQDHQTQNWAAEPGRGVGQCLESLLDHGHVARHVLALQIGDG